MSEQISMYDGIFNDIKKRLDEPGLLYTLKGEFKKFDAIPSDIACIDDCLFGGLPEGKVIEIFGSEASGKTTVTLHFIKAAQKRGYLVFFIDAEHALDQAYASRIGVDFSSLFLSQPDYGEQALEIARVMCESVEDFKEKNGKAVKALIVFDSVPALVPKGLFKIYEEEGYESTAAMAAQARMFATLLPPLVAKASKAGATVVFINQERDKIGVTWGSTTTTPGGRALKFFSSMRLKIVRTGFHQRGEEKIGIKVQLTPIKSKQFSIFGREAKFVITQDGINADLALAELAVEKGIVQKSGSHIKFGTQSFHGLDNFGDAIAADQQLKNNLISKVKESEQARNLSLKPKLAITINKQAAGVVPPKPQQALPQQSIAPQPTPAPAPQLAPQPAPQQQVTLEQLSRKEDQK